MFAYTEKPEKKIKYRTKIHITHEKVPYEVIKKPKKLSKYELLYKEAEVLKAYIMKNRHIYSSKMISGRVSAIYKMPEFQRLVKIGEIIRKKEIENKSWMMIFSVVIPVFIFAAAIIMDFLYIMPLAIVFVLMAILFFKPPIPFSKYYHNIYLPLCYNFANVLPKKDELEYKIEKINVNWNKDAVNKIIKTRSFKIITKDNITKVNRLIVRQNFNKYIMRRGKMLLAKKLVTVFSGYSFDMDILGDDISKEDKKEDSVVFAAINTNTFYHSLGVSDEDIANMHEIAPIFNHMKGKWKFYVANDFKIGKDKMREIQKKIVMLEKEAGEFNVYITKSAIRLMLGVAGMRDEIEEDSFKLSLSDTKLVSQENMYSVVKSLYILYFTEKLAYLTLGIFPETLKEKYKEKQLRKVSSKEAERKNKQREQKRARKMMLKRSDKF